MYEAYKKPNLVHKFKKAPKLNVELRFPTSEDELDFEYFMKSNPTMLEAKIHQVALLFEDTTLVTDEGKPILTKDDSVVMKCQILSQMPVGMIEEMHNALIAFYPDWELAE